MSKGVRRFIFRFANIFGSKLHHSPTISPKISEHLLDSLEPQFRFRLRSMYRGEPQLGINGQFYPIDKITLIQPEVGMWIYDLCRTAEPRATLEIGMAYGYSTLYFLAAMTRTGHLGVHTAIDPFQRSSWRGIGLAHAQTIAASNASNPCFQFIEERSDRAATDLARSGASFEIIFIDGSHRFDDVLVDFYLYAQLCPIGGYIIFDDISMSSVQTAVAFVRANRMDFAEVNTQGLNIAVFRKIGNDNARGWKHFRAFKMSCSSK